MTLRWQAAGISDTGLRRAHNEDTLILDQNEGVVIVADGMGGRPGGEYASSLAAGLMEVELYSRFGFSYSPRLFANVGGEAAKVAVREVGWGLFWVSLVIVVVVSVLTGLLGKKLLRLRMKRSWAAQPTIIALLSVLILANKWSAHSRRVFPLVRLIDEAQAFYLSPPRKLENVGLFFRWNFRER